MSPRALTDPTLVAAADQARAAAESIATDPAVVGEHLGMTMLGERLGTHRFDCLSAGYPGWHWAVTVARAPRAKHVTVCETALLPGDGALLAPPWVPYADRLAPGDLGPGDVLPRRADDPHLEAGFEATGEEDVDQMAFFELGLGRARVLSGEGRERAAQRWFDGDHGPSSPMAEQATARCRSCGYLVPMPGLLRMAFGVCASEWSASDGVVVSLDHGCGAHSETDLGSPEPMPVGRPLVDDFRLDLD